MGGPAAAGERASEGKGEEAAASGGPEVFGEYLDVCHFASKPNRSSPKRTCEELCLFTG